MLLIPDFENHLILSRLSKHSLINAKHNVMYDISMIRLYCYGLSTGGNKVWPLLLSQCYREHIVEIVVERQLYYDKEIRHNKRKRLGGNVIKCPNNVRLSVYGLSELAQGKYLNIHGVIVSL